MGSGTLDIVDDFSAEVGGEDLCVLDIVIGAGHYVPVDDHHVGELTWLKASLDVLLDSQDRAVLCVHPDGFLSGDLLLGPHLGVVDLGSPCYACPKAHEWREGGDWAIGSSGAHDSFVDPCPVGLEPLDSLWEELVVADVATEIKLETNR